MRWLMLIVVTTVVSCGNSNQEEIFIVEEVVDFDSLWNEALNIDSLNELPKDNENENSFLFFYEKFTESIIVKDSNKFNMYVHNNYGLYIIESTGAMPSLTKIYNISQFNSKSVKKKFFELIFPGIEKKAKYDFLPNVICDVQIYDKQGCFAQEINPLFESQIWNHASLNEKEIQAIEALAKTIKMTVINTSNFTFYFSNIDDKWYLTFLDLRVPCTA